MSFDMRNSVSVAGYALLIGMSVSVPALAEQDVLDRPAIMRTQERTTTSVLLVLQKAGKRLVAAGERGLILWSDDEGVIWKQAKVPVSVTLTSLSFADDKNGWATGHSGTVLGTTDGGQSWVKLFDGKRAAEVVAVEAKNSKASSAKIADAERLVVDGPDKPFLGVYFSDPNNGLIVGAYGLIFTTSDAGRTWKASQGHIENPKGLHLYAIHDAGEAIYLSGEQGSLFVSQDRGANFQPIKTPYQGTYFGVLTTGSNLLAFGMRGNAFFSGDKGKTWQKSEIPGNNTLTAGARLKDGRVMLVDDGGNILVSKDDGQRFAKAEMAKLTPLNSLIETDGGKLIFAGVRGISRASQTQTATDDKK